MEQYNIILAAGYVRESMRFLPFNGSFNPICGKPAIHWILSAIKDFDKTIIAVSENDVSLLKYLDCLYPAIKIVKMNKQSTICQSLFKCLNNIKNESRVELIFSDTFVSEIKTTSKENAFYTSSNIFDSKTWAIVECDRFGYIKKFYDKKNIQIRKNRKALIGYFKFSSSMALKKCFCNLNIKITNSIVPVLQKYCARFKVDSVDTDKWLDFGHIRGSAEARRNFISKQTREFNSLSLKSEMGVIEKCSANILKLKGEYIWYKSLPPALKVISPRVLSYEEKDGYASLAMELYGYHSLSECWVYGTSGFEEWARIIECIFKIQEKLRSYKMPKGVNVDLKEIYLEKTKARLRQLKNTGLSSALDEPVIFINGKAYRNLPLLKNNLFHLIKKELLESKDFSITHGDLCFSNILFDPNYYIFKLIDPRGSFGDIGIYGDPRYDIAKLRHSIVGMYDFMVAGFFDLRQQANNNFSFKINSINSAITLEKYFDLCVEKFAYKLSEIKLIEALLFLTMIPLHSESLPRQKAFYLTAIKKLNEVIN